MIEHCAYCLHRDEAMQSDACFYEREPRDCYDRDTRTPCRDLTEYGATYHCFKFDREMQMADWSEESARLERLSDTILQMLDRLEWRVANIEVGLRIAVRK